MMGLLSAGTGEGLMALGGSLKTGAKLAVQSVGGGTLSELGGGNFANGAITAAFSFLFNHAAHQMSEQSQAAFEACLEMAENAYALVGKADLDDHCNWFLRDRMREVGLYPDVDYNISAGEWGDPNKRDIGGWVIVDDNSPIQNGDIMAFKKNYGDATGHCAIMYIENTSKGTVARQIYTGSGDKVVKMSRIWRPKGATWIRRRFFGNPKR